MKSLRGDFAIVPTGWPQLFLLTQQTPSTLSSPSVKEKLMSRRVYISLTSLILLLVCTSQWNRATASGEKAHTISTLYVRLHNQPVQRRSTSPIQVPPLAASASNPDSKHLDETKPTLPTGTTTYSSETKPLLDRSTIQVKKIPALEMKTLILEQQFSNDVHYKVEGDLFPTGCTGLTALPENLSVEGDLHLSYCIGLTALPENLSVGGYLSLVSCIGLTALPENLSVRGRLSLDNCTGLTALPENLSVGRSLFLDGCTGLTALPENLSVEGLLSLEDCTGLTALPETLSVGHGLILKGCTGLTALPEKLSVGGCLFLGGCTGLTALPENLFVRDNLNLRDCTGLTALPENLSVGGHLSLRHCTGLSTLPENLSVEGSLYLDGCTGLTALPNWIAMLGSTSHGYTRLVYLENTGLSDALIDRLRTVEAPGMAFSFFQKCRAA